jgi:apolipoprotein N-acyltransferase
MRRTAEVAVAALSGVLLFLSCADFDIWPLTWFALVPTLHLIHKAPTARRALFLSFVTGVVANAGGFYWIVTLLERFGHLPWIVAALLFLLMSAYQALVFALFGWALYRIRQRTPLPMALLAPVVMVTFELCVPMLFPWYLAITQAWQVHVIQIADLAGPLGVTALLMAVNGALYDLVSRKRQGLRPALIVLGILALALGYGHLRIAQVTARRDAAPKIQVGVVQPNVAFDQKGVDNHTLALQQLGDLQRESVLLEAEGADLILWPESAYPFSIPRHAQGDVSSANVAQIRRGFSVPLAMGALTYDAHDPDAYPYNSALMVDAGGRFRARFDKMFLVWFSEHIPGVETFPFIRKLLPRAAGHFSMGKEVVTFPLITADDHEYRLGPMICYEDILPSFGLKLAALHPHLLINLTNDAWFGASSEPWEHLALSVYRAVELRTDLVRAVNTGVSAWVDSTGRVTKHTYSIDPAVTPHAADRFLGTAALVEGGHTVYATIGNAFAYACTAVTAFLWWVLPRLGRRRARSSKK